MKYDIDTIKIPGTLESLVSKGIELPDNAIPFKAEPILEHETNKNEIEVYKGKYAENILYYSDEYTIYNNDHTEITYKKENFVKMFKIFTRIWFLVKNKKEE